jgi:tRNA pseudouridine38-40 synthase
MAVVDISYNTLFLGVRVALRIAYDGRAFCGHQRQPDARTVEGECIGALKAAKILRDPKEAFFRSASRTDRGVSAVGNVIAFHSALRPDAVIGAFNDRARDVWAWAVAEVPAEFHPRHAKERWYRYHIYEDYPLSALREAGSLFVGEHDFRWFTSDPPTAVIPIHRVDVTREGDAILVDVRARSFRRGMVRRIVSALVGHARGSIRLQEIRAALVGERHDFGSVPPEPLFLMDVLYDFAFRTALKPKVLEEWRSLSLELSLRARLVRSIREAAARTGQ